MALANGTSRMRTGPVTLHTQTAIHVAEQLTNVSSDMNAHHKGPSHQVVIGTSQQDGPPKKRLSPMAIFLVAFAPPVATLKWRKPADSDFI